MKYKVFIYETLRKVVKVEAENASQAREIVHSQWENEEHVLGGDDFYDVEFDAVEDGNIPGTADKE